MHRTVASAHRSILTGMAVLAVSTVAVSACGGSSGSSSSPTRTKAAEVSPSGDIPDSQAFVSFKPATGGYTIQFPEPPPVAKRACAVCGQPFTPKTSQVRTCGRVCGGRSRSAEWRSLLGASPQPVCPDCGKPSSGLRRCQACRCHHGTVQAVLRTLGVLGEKYIPALYLRSSRNQRRALLAGLLDSDGTVTPTGSVQFLSLIHI